MKQHSLGPTVNEELKAPLNAIARIIYSTRTAAAGSEGWRTVASVPHLCAVLVSPVFQSFTP